MKYDEWLTQLQASIPLLQRLQQQFLDLDANPEPQYLDEASLRLAREQKRWAQAFLDLLDNAPPEAKQAMHAELEVLRGEAIAALNAVPFDLEPEPEQPSEH